MLSLKSTILSPPHTLFFPTYPLPLLGPGVSPVLGQEQGVSLPNDARLGHLLLHMQLETWPLGVLVSSYCCSTSRVAELFCSLSTFSSSSIGGPVFHPIDDCEHPLLLLSGTGRASQLYQDPVSKILLAYSIVSGFGGCLWDGFLGGTVSGWSFLLDLSPLLMIE